MHGIIPRDIYKRQPCSIVALGCALDIADRNALDAIKSPKLHEDGYLSLNDMNTLIRANLSVIRRVNYKRGERPVLRDFCHEFSGKAILCLEGHYVYVEGGNYWSFFKNGSDKIVCAWFLTQ